MLEYSVILARMLVCSAIIVDVSDKTILVDILDPIWVENVKTKTLPLLEVGDMGIETEAAISLEDELT